MTEIKTPRKAVLGKGTTIVRKRENGNDEKLNKILNENVKTRNPIH